MGIGTIATLGGLALSAAGTGVSIANAAATQKRMNDIIRSQVAASEEFQKQASPEFEKSLGASGAEAAKRALASGEQEALQGYREVSGVPTTAPSPFLQDSLINARVQARVGQSQQANAALQGYQNVGLQQFLANQRANQNLGIISGLAGSRAAITPFLLQGAQNQGQNLAAVGSLLGTAGSLAGVYGALYPYLQNPSPQPPVNRAGPGQE
jgi:hypothetical protein